MDQSLLIASRHARSKPMLAAPNMDEARGLWVPHAPSLRVGILGFFATATGRVPPNLLRRKVSN